MVHMTSHSRKATWDKVDALLASIESDDDRETLAEWVKHRRETELISPGTVASNLVQVRPVLALLENPLRVAAKTREFERAVIERTRRLKNPWVPRSTFGKLAKWLGGDDSWSSRPAGPSTRKRRSFHAKSFSIIPEEDFARALRECGTPENRAILYLFWETGMRPGELFSLSYHNIERDSSGYYYAQLPDEEEAFFNMKTGPRRMVLIESVAAVKEWLSNHPTKKGPLFLSPHGFPTNPLQPHGFRYRLGKWLPKYTMKDFRHTAATRATLAGWNEAMMRSFFGWEARSSMPSYYAIFTESDANTMRLRKAGLLEGEEEEAKLILPVHCPRCNTRNVRENVYCYACAAPIRADLAEAANAEAKRLREAESLETSLLAKLSREELLEALKRIADDKANG